MEQKVDSARRLVEANPDKLQAVRCLAAALAYQNRPPYALAAADRALAAIAAKPGVRVFDDEASSLALLVYTRAQLLRRLGRSEEAIAAQREAVEVAVS